MSGQSLVVLIQSMKRQKLISTLLSGTEFLIAAVPRLHSTSTAILYACGAAGTDD